MYQFKGFTEKANKALNLAIESAEEMRHNYVGTEHILYGLVKEGSGVAATALNECGVTEDALREKLESINGTMSLVELTPDDFTPRTKRVLRAAVIISSKNRLHLCRHRAFAPCNPFGERQLRSCFS